MVVDFNYTTVGLEVTFRNRSKDIPNNSKLLWNFGDGDEYSEENPIHNYKLSGIFSVSLSVKNQDDIIIGKCIQEVFVSNEVKTHLSGSIYELIDIYIPKSIFGYIPYNIKRQFIEKWQLYIQPLVDHEIPLEQYNNELYYEALENQLIMELAAYDFMSVELSNMFKAISSTVIENNSSEQISCNDGCISPNNIPSSQSSSSSSVSQYGGNSIKKIQTGPTEVEFFNNYELDSESASNVVKALQPGGILDLIKTNLCMLAERLDIYLPICDKDSKIVVPKVVNKRIKGPLSGPDPFFVVNK